MEIQETDIFLAGIRRYVSLDRQSSVRHALRLKLRHLDDGELCPPENRIGLYVTVLGGIGGPVRYIRVLYQINEERVILWSISPSRGV